MAISNKTMKKFNHLLSYFKKKEKIAVAFSGGVDSTFLLKTAQTVLGENVLALTAASPFFPDRELKEARSFCQQEGIHHIVFSFPVLASEKIVENPVNRCYFCKKQLFQTMQSLVKENGFHSLIEGSNVDDTGDYRPGLLAVAELGIESPLQNAGLTKQEIRQLSEEMGLPTWNKPSFACLASCFVYGEPITAERLSMVEQAEDFLFHKGFRQFRVRIHGTLARIEILPEEFEKIMQPEIRAEITKAFQTFGFHYVTMDLEGYRTGSMNESLK